MWAALFLSSMATRLASPEGQSWLCLEGSESPILTALACGALLKNYLSTPCWSCSFSMLSGPKREARGAQAHCEKFSWPKPILTFCSCGCAAKHRELGSSSGVQRLLFPAQERGTFSLYSALPLTWIDLEQSTQAGRLLELWDCSVWGMTKTPRGSHCSVWEGNVPSSPALEWAKHNSQFSIALEGDRGNEESKELNQKSKEAMGRQVGIRAALEICSCAFSRANKWLHTQHSHCCGSTENKCAH